MEQTHIPTIPEKIDSLSTEVVFNVDDLFIPCYHFAAKRTVFIKSTIVVSYTFGEGDTCGFNLAEVFDVPPGAHFLLGNNLYQKIAKKNLLSEKN